MYVFGNPSIWDCEIDRYLKSLVDDLVIIDVSDTASINLDDKKATC